MKIHNDENNRSLNIKQQTQIISHNTLLKTNHRLYNYAVLIKNIPLPNSF